MLIWCHHKLSSTLFWQSDQSLNILELLSQKTRSETYSCESDLIYTILTWWTRPLLEMVPHLKIFRLRGAACCCVLSVRETGAVIRRILVSVFPAISFDNYLHTCHISADQHQQHQQHPHNTHTNININNNIIIHIDIDSSDKSTWVWGLFHLQILQDFYWNLDVSKVVISVYCLKLSFVSKWIKFQRRVKLLNNY